MHRDAWTIVQACWGAWLVLWLVLAFSTKRTVQRADNSWSWVSRIVLVLAILVVFRGGLGVRRDSLWHESAAFDALGVALVLAGLAFTAWARVTLGANWSGTITFKEDHELVQRGPYAIVRHPIYTGIIAMVFGTAIVAGSWLGVVAAVAAIPLFYGKARGEERLMVEHFPDAYPAYRRRVRALIPYVL